MHEVQYCVILCVGERVMLTKIWNTPMKLQQGRYTDKYFAVIPYWGRMHVNQ